jgi:hypothetical protein
MLLFRYTHNQVVEGVSICLTPIVEGEGICTWRTVHVQAAPVQSLQSWQFKSIASTFLSKLYQVRNLATALVIQEYVQF